MIYNLWNCNKYCTTVPARGSVITYLSDRSSCRRCTHDQFHSLSGICPSSAHQDCQGSRRGLHSDSCRSYCIDGILSQNLKVDECYHDDQQVENILHCHML